MSDAQATGLVIMRQRIRQRIQIQWIGAIALLAVVFALPAHAAPSANKVTLSVEASGAEAPRGGMIPVDFIGLIERGWHINAHQPTDAYLIPTELSLVLPPGVTVEPLQYPVPDRKTFRFAGGKELKVYEGKIGIATGLHVPADFRGLRIRIEATLRYQACNDTLCLPPASASAELLLPVSATVVGSAEMATAQPAPTAPVSSVDEWLAERGLLFTLLAVALWGIALNLTPCVYPLISVTVAYFGGHANGSAQRRLGLALIYVLGIAVTFSVLGVAAALSGGLFGAALQKPTVILGLALLMVALALSSFGLYQLQPPAALMQWAGGSVSGASGAAFMGLTMGIVAAPCVGPTVLALLVAVGARQDPVLGFVLFFALAAGMGLPYVVLALAAGSVVQLPRSGEWLVWIERLFGCVLLAMAAYFIGPLLPAGLRAALLPAVVGASGLYLGFIDPSGARSALFRPVKWSAGIAAVALAVWLGWPHPAQSAIEWRALTAETPTANGRPMVIDFAAEWCIPCGEMARTTFVDSKVVRTATRFEMVRADITEENDHTRQLIERFDVRGVPTVLVFDAHGNEVQRLIGYTGPEELLTAMAEAEGSA